MKTNYLERTIKEGETTSLNDAVFDGTILVSEAMQLIRDKINNQKIGEIPTDGFGKVVTTVKNLGRKKNDQEDLREVEVDVFLIDTANLRKEFKGEPEIKEQNGKKYLVLDKENVYEVSEQIGNTVIGYNNINKMYIIYDLKNKTEITRNSTKFEKRIDGYYISWGAHDIGRIYMINNEGLRDLGSFKINGFIDKHGKSVYFPSIKYGTEENQIIVFKSDFETTVIPGNSARKVKTEKGKNILYVPINYCLGSYYDCDKEEIIFSGKKILDPMSSWRFDNNGTQNIGNEITTYTQILGYKKKKKYSL